MIYGEQIQQWRSQTWDPLPRNVHLIAVFNKRRVSRTLRGGVEENAWLLSHTHIQPIRKSHELTVTKTPEFARHQWLMPVIQATQEDHNLKPWQTVHETLSWKDLSQKRAGGVTQGVGPEFKLQHWKKKKKKNPKHQNSTITRYLYSWYLV
jgi:hypothetical protein